MYSFVVFFRSFFDSVKFLSVSLKQFLQSVRKMCFYGGMARLLSGLVLVVLLVRMSRAGFGDDISQDNEDNRFASKDNFVVF